MNFMLTIRDMNTKTNQNNYQIWDITYNEIKAIINAFKRIIDGCFAYEIIAYKEDK